MPVRRDDKESRSDVTLIIKAIGSSSVALCLLPPPSCQSPSPSYASLFTILPAPLPDLSRTGRFTNQALLDLALDPSPASSSLGAA
ncbi:UNVERIFIED_CONTAM: hypothetical protein K2H54_047863 [Gekko kuhli]